MKFDIDWRHDPNRTENFLPGIKKVKWCKHCGRRLPLGSGQNDYCIRSECQSFKLNISYNKRRERKLAKQSNA